MNDHIQRTTETQLNKQAGSAYSLTKRLKLVGTGSMKIIHLEGIDYIDHVEANKTKGAYLSFEIRPNALILILKRIEHFMPLMKTYLLFVRLVALMKRLYRKRNAEQIIAILNSNLPPDVRQLWLFNLPEEE